MNHATNRNRPGMTNHPAAHDAGEDELSGGGADKRDANG